ncbi:hypothetical protein A4H97_34215 [Niastella yeongjuensis]|uniref:Lipoprotein n=1 Tax=Niastella yeongjuensis TaxID=354355 RepID=A0A1V9E3R9_9BACT|nr:hypothetical protein [Niastella yeongjuensis]OQP40664.1 hypothetical protein A4H97_34215 [Niastella yeongjuensis]
MKKHYLIIIILFLTGCRGCVDNFYGVNPLGYVNITFPDCKIQNEYLKSYVDTVINRNVSIPDSINFKFFENGIPDINESIVHFAEEPVEWYVVSFDVSQPWIKFIYNRRLDSVNMIRERKLLSEKDILRIRRRFSNEVIKSAEVFGLSNHIPDSVIYRK